MSMIAALALMATGPALPAMASPTLAQISAGQTRRLELRFEGRVPVPILGQIKAAEARITADIGPTGYTARALAKSAGIVGWIVDYDLDVNVTGRTTNTGLRTTTYSSANNDGRRNRRVNMTYGPTEVQSASVPAWSDMGNPPATMAQRLESNDPVTSIVAMTLGLGATPTNLCGNPVPVFDGRVRYNLVMTNGQRMNVRERAWTGPAIQCDLRYVELAGGKLKTPEEIERERADIQWLRILFAEQADGSRFPIKIEARSRKRGRVTIEARQASFTTLPVATVQATSASR